MKKKNVNATVNTCIIPSVLFISHRVNVNVTIIISRFDILIVYVFFTFCILLVPSTLSFLHTKDSRNFKK